MLPWLVRHNASTGKLQSVLFLSWIFYLIIVGWDCRIIRVDWVNWWVSWWGLVVVVIVVIVILVLVFASLLWVNSGHWLGGSCGIIGVIVDVVLQGLKFRSLENNWMKLFFARNFLTSPERWRSQWGQLTKVSLLLSTGSLLSSQHSGENVSDKMSFLRYFIAAWKLAISAAPPPFVQNKCLNLSTKFRQVGCHNGIMLSWIKIEFGENWLCCGPSINLRWNSHLLTKTINWGCHKTIVSSFMFKLMGFCSWLMFVRAYGFKLLNRSPIVDLCREPDSR